MSMGRLVPEMVSIRWSDLSCSSEKLLTANGEEITNLAGK